MTVSVSASHSSAAPSDPQLTSFFPSLLTVTLSTCPPVPARSQRRGGEDERGSGGGRGGRAKVCV